MRPPRQLKAEALAQQIEKLLSKNPKTSFTSKQVARKINVSNTFEAIAEALKKMHQENKVMRVGVDHYKWGNKPISSRPVDAPKTTFKPEKQGRREKSYGFEQEIVGKLDMTKSGDAYLIADANQGIDDDIFISSKKLRGALDKDRVTVALISQARSRRPEGKVVNILERALARLIGTLRLYEHIDLVIPEDNRHIKEVIIHPEDINGAEDGDRVVIEITDWGKSARSGIRGKVLSTLENLSEHEARMQGILLSNGFDIVFPDDVMAEVSSIDGAITDSELKVRRDMRDTLTVTIDPLTAKDFDDAISYKALENDHVEVGIHIADVTHFLKSNSALDKEAFKRSTSVYLVDRVCPMLPHKLSNDLCSLNPHEDKYTFSAVFTFNEERKIINEWFGKTIIHSDRRFTYEEAQERLETKEGDFADELNQLNEIALILRAERYKNGSISFESEEVQFSLDEDNQPTGVHIRERKAAHMLIEDFMLLANRKVAAYLFNKTKPEIPLVYRIHDLPNPDKLADFALFAKELGYTFRFDKPDQIAYSFNKLAEAAEDNPILKMLEPLAIRTMAKAEYSTKNIGHYGLGFEFYSHFTSPIRRYADVMVHRTLFNNLGKDTMRENQEEMEARAKHISQMERKANDAERESIKYMQAVYISKFIGQTFEGVISGMIDKGIFVELKASKVEGFVPFDSMIESYTVNSARTKAMSRISKDEFKMGQSINVLIVSADTDAARIEMRLVDNED
jgi:ribonuclease R